MIPLGLFFYHRLNIVNKLKPTGLDILAELPKRNVLFLSNHQTYFADVAAMVTLMSAAKWGRKNDKLRAPFYLLNPKLNFHYVAASETMKSSGIVPRIFAYCGAITVSRTWRSKGEQVQRDVNPKDQSNIGKALDNGWLISFPQGTTTPFSPGRKGTAYIMKENNPIVIPVRIDGFRRAFDKKGLLLKKKKTDLRVDFLSPIEYDPDESVDDIMEKVMQGIGQVSNNPDQIEK